MKTPVCQWADCRPVKFATVLQWLDRPCGHFYRAISACAEHEALKPEGAAAAVATVCQRCGEKNRIFVSRNSPL